MARRPEGTQLVRPFVPTKDFARSKRFYEALGFENVLDGDVAIFKAGSGGCVVDPAGVLWHVAQRREGGVHDR